MNNQLSENLKKIRKDHHLSQEQLAEELGVSRQAISKWESSLAYPEMDKIIQLCDKFDVNIDDLLHRDIQEIKEEEASKNNLNKYIDDFLRFITDSITLFINMDWKSKLKFLIEEIILFLLLCIIVFLGEGILREILFLMFDGIFPYQLTNSISNILSSIYFVFAIGISCVIMLHIFKTRYLDYYWNIKKEKESGVQEEKQITFKKNESKIIIRDPKHSEYRFMRGLFQLLMMIMKGFVFLISIGLSFFIIGLLTLFVFSFTMIRTKIFFFGVACGLLSLIVIDFSTILFFLNFVFNHKTDSKKLIRIFLGSLLILGISCGFVMIGSLQFDMVDEEKSDLVEKRNVEIPMKEGAFFQSEKVSYIEENRNNIKIEYTINQLCQFHYDDSTAGIYLYGSCNNPTSIIREWIKNINDQKIVPITNEIFNIRVYASKENIEKLKINQQKYYNNEYENQYRMDTDELEEEIGN